VLGSAWIITFAPLAGLAINVACEIAVTHAFRFSLWISIMTGALSGLAATIGLILFAVVDLSLQQIQLADIWLVDGLTYAALAIGFWAFLNLNVTSLRIRMLRTILRADGVLKKSDLLAEYTLEERLHRRLKRLRNAGQIRLNGDRWQLTASGVLMIARGIEVLRLLILPSQQRKRVSLDANH
jgi:hypothetical protein